MEENKIKIHISDKDSLTYVIMLIRLNRIDCTIFTRHATRCLSDPIIESKHEIQFWRHHHVVNMIVIISFISIIYHGGFDVNSFDLIWELSVRLSFNIKVYSSFDLSRDFMTHLRKSKSMSLTSSKRGMFSESFLNWYLYWPLPLISWRENWCAQILFE